MSKNISEDRIPEDVLAEQWYGLMHQVIGKGDAHTRSAPVDVGAVAQDFGLEIFSSRLREGISGALVRDPSRGTRSQFVIYVNSREPSVRQRFTAAHELGHYLLHRSLIGERVEDNYLLRAAGFSNQQEIEANRFAANLLMPKHLIEFEMQAGNRTPDALAKKFQVSVTAMSIQLGLPT